MTTPSVQLSIVAPCYNEEAGLDEFCSRAIAAAAALRPAGGFEVVLVDDGSRDATWQAIERLADAHPEVIGVRLMRNYGHQLAATAGLAVSRGDRVMLIDADLQDPPELLGPMMAAMDEGADVVYGQRIHREGETRFKLMTAFLFYRLLSRLTSVDIPRDTGDFRLMTRRVVDLLTAMPERHRFIRGMVSWIGGRQVAMPYRRDPRFAGSSGYPLRKMLRFATDAITSFSTAPLRFATWLGLAAAVVAILIGAYSFWQWARGAVLPGWSSTMIAVSSFSAVQLIVLGIIGEYLGRLVQEQKQRPMFVIDRLVHSRSVGVVADDFYRLPGQARHRHVASAFGPQQPAPAPQGGRLAPASGGATGVAAS